MKRLRNSLIGVDQGEEILFADFEDDGPMWSEAGPRTNETKVMFKEKFRSVPSVQVGLSMWDIDTRANVRTDIIAENVTETGFTIVFKTWGDTRVARVRATWMAIGELPFADDWDLY